MGFVRSLWASVQGDPVFMRRVNGWLTIFWIASEAIELFITEEDAGAAPLRIVYAMSPSGVAASR